MTVSGEAIEKLRPNVRFKVAYEVGFFCPDIDDLVQESLTRLFRAVEEDKLVKPESLAPFLYGICRNVISEYRRRSRREEPMPEVPPEPPPKGLPAADLLALRQTIAHSLEQLSERDRLVLRAFYLEEKSKEEILGLTGMSDDNFRVVLCRAKERFRAIYNRGPQQRGVSGH